MSVRQLANFVYSWAIKLVDPERVEEWIAGLDEPYWEVRRTERVTSTTIEDELSTFAAAAGA